MDDIQFIGYQWQAVKDSLGNSKMTVSTIGTTTSVYYVRASNDQSGPPATGSIERDGTRTIVAAHLQRSVTRSGGACAENFLTQPLSVVAYDSITLAMYGFRPRGTTAWGPFTTARSSSYSGSAAIPRPTMNTGRRYSRTGIILYV